MINIALIGLGGIFTLVMLSGLVMMRGKNIRLKD